MKLERVEIKNFRSIDELTLKIEYGCQTLLGINESGKSNILRALHFLDPDTPISPGDLRIERHEESPVTAGHIRFVFTLDAADIENIYKVLSAKFVSSYGNKQRSHLIAVGEKKETLEQYCQRVKEGLYITDLPSGARRFSVWQRPKNELLIGEWFKNETDAEITISPTGNEEIKIPAGSYFEFSETTITSAPGIKKITFEDFKVLHSKLIQDLVKENFPKCIFWKYADQYLLPSSINAEQFCANVNSCIPLKSMFDLAKYDTNDLGRVLTEAKTQGRHRYSGILDKTAAAATKYIREVWRDYKTISIKLEPDGELLIPTIVDDSIKMDMGNRSEGFKRFVSFLLQISAKVKIDEIKNALIIVDEPEIGLHPSGAKNLMHELIKIGNTNTIIYSTHSIFMIDKDIIGRHLVVEKVKEVTKTWRAERSRVQDEEVLYSAMGYSIFETLKKRNIIFEGWRDKALFMVVADAICKVNPEAKKTLETIGLTFAEGVKDVGNVARFLQLADRSCLIISDSDKAALERKKSYMQPGAWGKWMTLSEILSNSQIQTPEDLIQRPAIIKRANKVFEKIDGLDPLTEEFFKPKEFTMAGLQRWVAERSGLAGDELKIAVNIIKESIFNGLKRAEIIDEAEDLVKYVLTHEF